MSGEPRQNDGAVDGPPIASGDDAVERAARALRAGKLVGLPTETVYGLAANALDPEAVAGIFDAKQRPSFDPLIVHVATVEAANAVFAAPLTGAGAELAAAFWPGPLTLVAPKAAAIPDIVTSGLDTVAVRVPAHPVARAVLEASALPLAAPSANRFGSVSPTRAEHVVEQLADSVALVVDGGPCTYGVESTIVSLTGDVPTVLRFGGVTVEEIESVVGPVARRTHSSDRPEAPGQLSRHYATRTPLRLLEVDGPTATAVSLDPAPDAALLVVAGEAPDGADGYGRVECLSPDGDLRAAAHRLFAAMRQLDTASVGRIDVIPCAEHGLGRAILDRLRRAAVSHAPDPA